MAEMVFAGADEELLPVGTKVDINVGGGGIGGGGTVKRG